MSEGDSSHALQAPLSIERENNAVATLVSYVGLVGDYVRTCLEVSLRAVAERARKWSTYRASIARISVARKVAFLVPRWCLQGASGLKDSSISTIGVMPKCGLTGVEPPALNG